MTIKTNLDCGCGCDGDCAPDDQKRLHGNLSSGARHETFLGRDHLVVPLVMLRETVVNGGLVTMAELKPQGWNGVPVTIGHPNVNGQSVSANSPAVTEAWRVGQIFNAKLDGDKLKAEAWIDVAEAERRHPGITLLLEGGSGMDVSTGYFSTDELTFGVFNDKPYFEVHRDIKPDHLALLPDEVGACSWADGCGVRINKEPVVSDKKTATSGDQEAAGIRRLLAAIGMASPTTNRRGNDDDYRQIIADLISNDDSPFVPDDEFALREMSLESLKDVRDRYLPKPTTNKQGGPEMAEETKGAEAPKPEVAAMTADQITELVTNAVTAAVNPAVTAAVDEAMNATKRADLIDAIHENMGVEKEELAKLATNALEAMAPKSGKADFSGRGLQTNGDDTGVAKFPGMGNPRAALEKKEA